MALKLHSIPPSSLLQCDLNLAKDACTNYCQIEPHIVGVSTSIDLSEQHNFTQSTTLGGRALATRLGQESVGPGLPVSLSGMVTASGWHGEWGPRTGKRARQSL